MRCWRNGIARAFQALRCRFKSGAPLRVGPRRPARSFRFHRTPGVMLESVMLLTAEKLAAATGCVRGLVKECRRCGTLCALDEYHRKMQRGKETRIAVCVFCARAEKRAYAAADPAKNRARVRAWQAANRERRQAYMRQWQRDRRATDPRHRLNNAIRTGVNLSLRCGKKGARTYAVLGYSCEELMRHLERQFLTGMKWGNIGQWHIDHILPLASFSFTNHADPDFKRAWALTNLRPLWGADNRRKADKIEVLL